MLCEPEGKNGGYHLCVCVCVSVNIFVFIYIKTCLTQMFPSHLELYLLFFNRYVITGLTFEGEMSTTATKPK